MRDDVDPRPGAHRVANDLQGRGKIIQGDVVHVVARAPQVVAVSVAHAVVERPDIGEAVVEQELNEVAMLRHDEHVAGRREAVRDDDDVLAGLTLEPEQAQTQLVRGGEGMDGELCSVHALRGVDGDLPPVRVDARRERGPVYLPQITEEQLPEPFESAGPLGGGGRPRPERRQLMHEVEQVDLEDAGRQHLRARLVGCSDVPGEDVREEGGRIPPRLRDRRRLHVLEAAERQGPSLRVLEEEAIEHLLRLQARAGHEQVEHAVLHWKLPAEPLAEDIPRRRPLVLRVGDELVDVAGVDRQSEHEVGAVGAALCETVLKVRLTESDEALHLFGEAHAAECPVHHVRHPRSRRHSPYEGLNQAVNRSC